jgi:hypothetical protein
MQSQAKKDAELRLSAEAGDYNRVLKYLGRGAKITEDTLHVIKGRIEDISNTDRPLDRDDFYNMQNNLNIFKLLTSKYKTTDYSSMIPIAEEAIRVRREEERRINIERQEAQRRAEEAEAARDRARWAAAARYRQLDSAAVQARRRATERRIEAERELNLGGPGAGADAMATRAERAEAEADAAESAADAAMVGNENEIAAARAWVVGARAAAVAAVRAQYEERQRRELERLWRRDAAADEMVRGLRETRAERAAGRGNNALEVHIAFEKFSAKVPVILDVIKRDLGNPKEYPDIKAIFKPLYTYIKTNSAFKSKAINSIRVKKPNGTMGPRMVSRAEWISDLEKVEQGVSGSYQDKKDQMGLIFDFIIKHTEITECFIAGFVHDCTHAYSNGHLSCYKGILERTITTLINCMKGMNEGVFGEINRIIEDNIRSWDELDKATQGVYIMRWNDFLLKWSQTNAEVDDIKRMNPAERNEAVMIDFKREENIPRYVEEHIRAELFPGLTEGVWSDYGFNSPAGLGGRRRKTRRYRKSKRTRRQP